MLGDGSPDIHLTDVLSKGYTVSNVESQVFTPNNFNSTAGIQTPDPEPTRPMCLATQPWLLQC